MKYFWVWGIVILMGIVGIKWWGMKNFSQEKMLAMIETPGRNLEITDDPCKFWTAGNPTQPDRRTARLMWVCGGGREARNTLSWVAVKEKTVAGVVAEVTRINGINYAAVKNWHCDVDGKPANDWSEKVVFDSLIKCKK